MNRVAGLVALGIVWEIAARIAHHPLFCPLSTVLPALLRLFVTGEAVRHMATTLTNVLIGFTIAAATGITLGILICESRTIEAVMMPVIDAMRPIAALTLFPVVILFLGLGLRSKVFIIFWTAWPACVINTIQGIRDVDPQVIEAGQLDGAGRWALLRHIRLPLALPVIMTGLRIGMGGGWIAVASSEMLGSSSGLGYSILAYSQSFRFPEMYATILLIALLGLAMNLILADLQKRIDYNGGKGKNGLESRALRFGDRAASWSIDSLR